MSEPAEVHGTGAVGPEPTPLLDHPAALELLRHGDIVVEGRLVMASNATLLCSISANGVEAECVYKPIAGERPLWDFPDGTLAGREVSAYAVSHATGWNIVPPTIHRDGPFGPGMVQLWIDGDDTVDLVELVQSDNPVLRRMAVFDAVVNNADRKGGHLIPMPDGHIYGVDHGICFAVDEKLRTVLWGWAGKRLTAEAVEVLTVLDEQLAGDLGATLGEYLTRREVATTRARVRRLLRTGRHPLPPEDSHAIPWPPF